jgi:hypothetical protein
LETSKEFKRGVIIHQCKHISVYTTILNSHIISNTIHERAQTSTKHSNITSSSKGIPFLIRPIHLNWQSSQLKIRRHNVKTLTSPSMLQRKGEFPSSTSKRRIPPTQARHHQACRPSSWGTGLPRLHI